MIMVIVISHFEFLKQLPSIGLFYTKYIYNPSLAVNYFFLLSGFGMMLSNLKKYSFNELKHPNASFCIKYGIRHIKKIYPVYLATIIFGFSFKVFLIIYEHNISIKNFCFEVIKLAVNIPLLQSATCMLFFTHAYNGVSWFLSSLFLIYFISPLLIYILRKSSKSIVTDILFIFFNIIFIILSIVFFEFLEIKIPHLNNLDGSPYARVFFVLIGMNLGMLFYKLQNYSEKVSSITMTFAEIIISTLSTIYCLYRNSLPEGKYKYIIDLSLCSSLILIFAFDKGIISKLLGTHCFQTLGNMSMYIFLIHYPIRTYFAYFINKIWGWNSASSFIFIFVILSLTFLLSSICYFFSKHYNSAPAQ